MPENAVIVWDLETVPDLKAAARMYGLDDHAEEEARGMLGPGFIPRFGRCPLALHCLCSEI